MQENLPLISVCMPAYNAGRFITEAIESVISQTYTNWELIIVNDGSVDDTLEKAEKFCSDKRIKIFTQENKGQCAAANKAFSYSEGDYIKFFDADDILSPKFLEAQINGLNGSECKIASAKWGRFYNDNRNSFTLETEFILENQKPVDWLVKSMNDGFIMLQCALFLIPRKVLVKSGLWDEKLSLINDFDFIFRALLSANEIVSSQESILYYRSGVNNSLSSQKSLKSLESAFYSISSGLTELLKHENSKRTRKMAADTYILWAYEFYPTAYQLYKKSMNKVKENGGSDVKFPSGGITKFLIYFLGWKLTKRLKYLVNIC